MALMPFTLCFSCLCYDFFQESSQQCCCCCPNSCQDYQKLHVFNSLQPICENISDEKLIWKPIFKHARDYKDETLLEYLRLEVKLRYPIEPFEPVRLLPEKEWDKVLLAETVTKIGSRQNSCIMQCLGICFNIPTFIDNVEIHELIFNVYWSAKSSCLQNIYEVGLDAEGKKTVYAPGEPSPPLSLSFAEDQLVLSNSPLLIEGGPSSAYQIPKSEL